MAGSYILAIDQGTSSSRALLLDGDGRVVARGQRQLASNFPAPGLVEQDPDDIWQSVVDAAGVAMAGARLTAADIGAIGIANQRETVLVWDQRSGEPLSPAISWQDRRSAAICEELRAAGHEAAVTRATGLRLDPYFSATKLAWLFRSRPDLRRRGEAGEIVAGTIDSWLVWNLTGGERFVSDYTNASRTALFNVRTGRWDDQLTALFGVPRAMLPQAQPSASAFGATDRRVFGAEVPILAVAGDQQAALYGQACHLPGQAKATYGTGCFLVAEVGARPTGTSKGGLLSIGAMAGAGGPDYVLEGSVFTAGALIDWLREVGIIASVEEVGGLAGSVRDSGGATIVPAFAGLGAPDWDPRARGTVIGVTGGTTRAHLARAALEAIALSTAEVATALTSDLGMTIEELRVDGGLARQDLLLQLQADFAGIPVVRPVETESTAMGVAMLAGEGLGLWTREQAARLWRPGSRFEPSISSDERGERLRQWRRAVERSLGWAEES